MPAQRRSRSRSGDYWAHSISVAAAASVAAEILGVAQNEAFSAGLLHDFGSALLHRADPVGYAQLCEAVEPGKLEEAERREYGHSHSEVGAEALTLWQYPKLFVQAIATHHEPVENVNALAQAVILGQALAERIEPLLPIEGGQRLEEIIEVLGFHASVRDRLLARSREEIGSIGSFLGEAR